MATGSCRAVATRRSIVGDVLQCCRLAKVTAEELMASFAPLHTGQFIIKPRSLHKRRSTWVGLLLLIVLVPYGTFELGRALSGYSIVSSQREHMAQVARIDALQDEVTKLQRELGSAQMGRKVDQLSTDSMQQSFAGLQATIQKQQEEIGFYKAIVSPDANVPVEPQVQRFEVQPDVVANRYRIRLVLIQAMSATSNAQGTIQVQVTGTRQGQSVSLSWQDLLVDKNEASLKFSYRYFQTLEQLVDVPADFQPLAVQIELHANQRPVQRQEFPWQPPTA
jgi:hypothetical protein